MKKTINLIVASLLIVFTTLAQDNYELTSGSTIKVAGTSTLHDWEAVSNEVVGKLKLDRKGKAKKNQPLKGNVAAGDITVLVESLKSERGETMNGKMHRALLYDEHPNVTFELTDAIDLEPTKESDTSTIVTGQLTIAGVGKSVGIEVALTSIADTISIKGSKAIELSDFEIEPPSAMFGQIKTGNDIVISFDLSFSK